MSPAEVEETNETVKRVLAHMGNPIPLTEYEQTVREKAYLLWEAAGYPPSDGVDFWLQAEKDMFPVLERE